MTDPSERSSVSQTARLPRRILIANRGEIVVRIARTCRRMGIAPATVFSDADAGALHVRVCDDAIRLPGTTPADTYLRPDLLVTAAHRLGAEAVHPGFGFLAEDPAFARSVIDAGLIWIGPQPEVIARMGDKLAAKATMADAGVPVLAGAEVHDGADHDALFAAAAAVGFPLMVKPAAGGGGKGMRVVHDRVELAPAVDASRREAVRAFGDGRLFLERFVVSPRHLEVQVLGDAHGNLVHLFERECSIQRRHQKVVEETPSAAIDAPVRAALCQAAVDAASAIGYRNAGTIEFVADEGLLARRRAGEPVEPRDTFAFLEANTRLQVEHPVTEEVVQVRRPGGPIDLVRLQILVAAGAPLPFAQEDLTQHGHAIEVRLYAEDAAAGYLPATGRLAVFDPDATVRWDLGVQAGEEVGPYYDPMLAKAIAHAPTRGEAAAVLAGALGRTPIVGVTTNQDLLVAVLGDEAFLEGDTTTAFLEERGDVLFAQPPDHQVELAVIAAALHDALSRKVPGTVPPSLPSLRAGFAPAGTFDPRVEFIVDGQTSQVRYRQQRDGRWRVRIADEPDPDSWVSLDRDESARTVTVVERTASMLTFELDGHRHRVRVVAADGQRAVGLDGRWIRLTTTPRFPPHTPVRSPGASVSPMPGRVVQAAVAVGDEVTQGALLVTVEAMKMEHRLTAPLAGRVTEVLVAVGDQVDADEVVVVVSPQGGESGKEGREEGGVEGLAR